MFWKECEAHKLQESLSLEEDHIRLLEDEAKHLENQVKHLEEEVIKVRHQLQLEMGNFFAC